MLMKVANTKFHKKITPMLSQAQKNTLRDASKPVTGTRCVRAIKYKLIPCTSLYVSRSVRCILSICG